MTSEPSLWTTPINRDRITSFLDKEHFSYAVDEDGDVHGFWSGHGFYFFLLGDQREILQIRGKWSSRVPVARYQDLMLTINEWNRERIWPKVYARIEDTDLVAVYAETSTDLEQGATDEQIDQLIRCGLSTGVQVFEHLKENFPDAIETDTRPS